MCISTTSIRTFSVYKRGKRAGQCKKTNDKDGSEDNKTLCSAKWKNSVFIAFLRIPKLAKSKLTLFLMKIQTTTVNLDLCSLHFTMDSFLNKAQLDTRFKKRLTLKDYAVPTILDPTVMSQHKCE